MMQVEVAEKAAAELRNLALQDARPIQDLVSEALQAYISFRYLEPDLTASQIERLQQSMMQADRGELVSQEQIEAFFDDWEKEAASR